MANSYLALDLAKGREVALKVLAPARQHAALEASGRTAFTSTSGHIGAQIAVGLEAAHRHRAPRSPRALERRSFDRYRQAAKTTAP